MKKIFTLVFLLVAINSFAQNWKPFLLNDTLYYRTERFADTSSSNYHLCNSIFVSYTEPIGTDSVYYFCNYLNDTTYTDTLGQTFDYFDTTGDSWMLDKYVLNTNDDCFFISSANDSFLIKLNTNLGQTWTMYNDTASQLEYKLTVTKQDVELVNGINDSIKELKLSTFINGSPSNSRYNNQLFKISKNNGFLLMPPLLGILGDGNSFNTYNDSLYYELVPRKYYNKTIERNYDYLMQTGNVFYTQYYKPGTTNTSSVPVSWYGYDSIIQCIKTAPGQFDITAKIIYKYNRSGYDYSTIPPIYVDSSVYINTIVNFTYFSGINSYYGFPHLPEPNYTFPSNGVYLIDNLSYLFDFDYTPINNIGFKSSSAVGTNYICNGLLSLGLTHSNMSGSFAYDSSINFYKNIYPVKENINYSDNYIDSIGISNFDCYYWDFSTGLVVNCGYMNLGYFKINGCQYGTLYPFWLLSNSNLNTNIKIDIFPNPVEDVLNISTTEKVNSIELIDITGRTIKTFKPNNKSLDLSEINSGNYYLRVATSKGVATKKILKQ